MVHFVTHVEYVIYFNVLNMVYNIYSRGIMGLSGWGQLAKNSQYLLTHLLSNKHAILGIFHQNNVKSHHYLCYDLV